MYEYRSVPQILAIFERVYEPVGTVMKAAAIIEARSRSMDLKHYSLIVE